MQTIPLKRKWGPAATLFVREVLQASSAEENITHEALKLQ
jgi:hypothetical protein